MKHLADLRKVSIKPNVEKCMLNYGSHNIISSNSSGEKRAVRLALSKKKVQGKK